MLSVIVPTRDRAEILRTTLEALVAQEWPGEPFEIVVADNGSEDHTAAVVESIARRSPARVSYISETRPGKSHALNTAVTRAEGDLLAFIDDDVIPSPRWLAAFARALNETGADYAVGRILPLWETTPPSWMSAPLYGALSVADAGTVRLPLSKGTNDHIMALGGNLALRRYVLDRVGGWNPDLGALQGTARTGEDHEFGLRMTSAGFTGVYEPEARVQHRVSRDRLRLAYFRRWFYDNGMIVAGLEQEYPSTARYLLHVPRYMWRQMAQALVETAWGILTWNSRRSAVGEARLAWFAGYVRGRWTRREPARTDAAAATPRS